MLFAEVWFAEEMEMEILWPNWEGCDLRLMEGHRFHMTFTLFLDLQFAIFR
jgi:hypothetical protein